MGINTWHERIPLIDTKRFTALVTDYVAQSPQVAPWITAFPSPAAMGKALASKQQHKLQREILVTVLREQYTGLPQSIAVNEQIDLLLDDNTFSVCTAHQPLLFTGPMYFIYKTIHALVLAKKLGEQFPDKKFVPVFYLGTEDHDLDEIGHCRIQTENLVWDTPQQGACGRMQTSNMQPVMAAYRKYWNEAIPCEKAWLEAIEMAYDGQRTLAEATRYLLHHLFGSKGLVVLDADSKALKQLFVPVMEQELFGEPSIQRLQTTLQALQATYTLQATPRNINLFYLTEQGRFRIEKNETGWHTIGSTTQWHEASLRSELQDHPERFSPNVILRPLYQETILPNVAFIGGGGELAYWIPLKANFDFFGVPFPILFLRNSLLYVNASQKKSLTQKNINNRALFLTPDAWFQQQAAESTWLQQWQETENEIQTALLNYQTLSKNLSADYQETITAHRAKINRLLARITQKTTAHIKRREQALWDGFVQMQQKLFPDGNLQERTEHGLMLMKYLGEDWLEVLMSVQDPYSETFTVFGETD